MTTDAPLPLVNTPASELLAWRIARSAVAAVLVVAATFLIGLAIVGWSSTARAAIGPLLSFTVKGVSTSAAAFTLAFILLTPTALFILAARRRWLTWKTLATGLVAVIACLVWLAWDEPAIRRPLTLDEISPPFEGAEKSYAVLMRYSKQHPAPEAVAFAKFKPTVTWSGTSPAEPEKWLEFITKNRPGLEADWAALAPQRQWLTELNAFDRIGDLGTASFNSDIIRYDAWRTLSQRAAAIASLQVLDGRGDDALRTILPLLELARKLQPSSRTLVRTMIGLAVQRLSTDTITFILNRHTPSPALRPALAAALAGGNSAAGARRMILLEYPTFAATVSTMTLADQHIIGNARARVENPLTKLSVFLLNPIATVNAYGDHLHELAALAEARELGKLAVRGASFVQDLSRHGSPKNIGGAIVLNIAVPSYDKVVKSFWEIETARHALHARVTALPL